MSATLASRRISPQGGFTAVEILLVLAVIAIVAAMAVPAYNGAVFRAEVAASESDLESMASAIDIYIQANGALPDDLDEVGYGAIEDPWGNPYVYLPLAPPDAKSPIAGVPSTLVNTLQEFVQTEALAGRSHPEGQKLLN